MLIPSYLSVDCIISPSLSRRVNANSQLINEVADDVRKLIKKGEC